MEQQASTIVGHFLLSPRSSMCVTDAMLHRRTLGSIAHTTDTPQLMRQCQRFDSSWSYGSRRTSLMQPSSHDHELVDQLKQRLGMKSAEQAPDEEQDDAEE